jgi:superfamily II DNA/RNA helicase
MISVLQQLADEAFEDEYLKELLHKLEENFCSNFYKSPYQANLTDLEINHLLRFSDILCRSKNSLHRNLSLKIISLLLEINEIKNLDYFQLIATNTLVKLGNFPSLKIINGNTKYLKIDEIRNDYIIKTIAQISPLEIPFTDAQYSVFEEMKKRNHYSFSGSTSFGKSFIFEAFTKYIIKEHNRTDNIAFIVPTKALINQVENQLRKISTDFNYRIITTPIIPKVFFNQDNRYIFIFTPERLISYFMDLNNPKIDYLFVDEAHKLLSNKDTRTPLLYHSLVLAKRKSVNIYFASPNIPNADIFLKLINNSTEESMSITESPVSQNRFFIDTIQNISFMISDFGDDIYFPKFNFCKDIITNLKIILNIFSKGNQSIIYCNTVDKTIQTAINFSNKLDDIESESINQTINLIDDKIHHQYYLKRCLKKGVAYHFSGIPEEIKLQVENLYRQGEIQYLFCTSTLLEGINFPAKNIFILSENIGNGKMTDIDFWNLAGRAGRLSKDISGNIFCVNLFNQRGYWKESKDNLKIFRNKKIHEVEPLILSKRNQNLYKNITCYLEEKDYTNNNLSEEKKKMIEMYGNILLFHDSINSDSVLKDNFIDSSNNSVAILKKTRANLNVAPEILATSIGINIADQNRIATHDVPMLPNETKYEDCLQVLNILYNQYMWEKNESKGRNPMIRNKNQLKYYATIMETWINSKPLKVLIQKTIDYYYNNGNERFIYIRQEDGIIKPIKFEKQNEFHINKIINDVVSDLENVLRFKIKNYISNYQSLIKNKSDINSNITDWENYIEYGTTDNRIIEIQNLGFPRNIAIFLRKYYIEAFVKNDNGSIFDVNEKYLFENIDKARFKSEYKELALFMNWN